MTNQELVQEIRAAVKKLCISRDINTVDEFANKVASIFYAGDMCARANDCNWIDGEGYPQAYWDWNITGMKNALKYDHPSQKVREFYAQFFG